MELREKALEAIKERVISQNVVVEAFSLFTSWSVAWPHSLSCNPPWVTPINRYPDIQAFQTRLLQKSLHIGSVRDSYNHKVRAACDGELPRAFQVLTTLTKALIDNQKE